MNFHNNYTTNPKAATKRAQTLQELLGLSRNYAIGRIVPKAVAKPLVMPPAPAPKPVGNPPHQAPDPPPHAAPVADHEPVVRQALDLVGVAVGNLVNVNQDYQRQIDQLQQQLARRETGQQQRVVVQPVQPKVEQRPPVVPEPVFVIWANGECASYHEQHTELCEAGICVVCYFTSFPPQRFV
jgi:hypothetical protein